MESQFIKIPQLDGSIRCGTRDAQEWCIQAYPASASKNYCASIGYAFRPKHNDELTLKRST
jgi:hypothetical protein